MKSLALAGAAALSISAPASAEYLYGFGSASVNYLDWSNKAEDLSNGFKEDFLFLELEGGAGFSWGEMYGFIDLENPGSIGNGDKDGKPDGFRLAAKGTIGLNTGVNNLQVYGQLYTLNESGSQGNTFQVQNYVGGLRYNVFTESGFWFKPFLGAHIESNNFAGTGYNGLMAGWVLGYDFNVGNQKLSVSNWHETEFLREDQFRQGGALDSVGHNGAVALWWHLPAKFTLGLQYRYYDHKLGDAGYGDALIYTVKYNF
ncbi:outer membrane protein OmpK [Ferrimonas gelatinilytica]|uniref:Outer membrane protein OmpK n=1 Tax=Ferrimonas gelatinilytica TaxID=1255257 RepID=A0ABP9RUE3_9GAMM